MFRGRGGRGRGRGGRGRFVARGPTQENNSDNKTLRVPKFGKVKDLQPGTVNQNLVIKVVNINLDVKTEGPSPKQVAEILVGDETGCVIFTAIGDQIQQFKVGDCLILRNARVDLFKSKMRLKIDKWGLVQTFEDGSKKVSVPLSSNFEVLTSNNVSDKEYQVVYEYVKE